MCRHLLLNPFIDLVTVRLRVQASQQFVRDEHAQTRYSRSFVVRDSRWSKAKVQCMSDQCLIQDKISTSPSPTAAQSSRRAVVAPRGRHVAHGRHIGRYFYLIILPNVTNNSTFPKIKLHYSISYCNKTKSNNLI